jgi:ferredoxin
MKSKLKIIIPIVLVSSAAFILFQVKGNSSPQITSSTNSTQKQTDKTAITVVLQKLSVLSNRCIGCGKCVRIDPSHFEINGNKSTVISSTNLSSPNLQLAINNCPVQAITLE